MTDPLRARLDMLQTLDSSFLIVDALRAVLDRCEKHQPLCCGGGCLGHYEPLPFSVWGSRKRLPDCASVCHCISGGIRRAIAESLGVEL